MGRGTSPHGRTLDDSAFRRLVIEQAEAHILALTGNRREAMLAFDVHGREILSKLGDAVEVSFTATKFCRWWGKLIWSCTTTTSARRHQKRISCLLPA